MPARMDTHERGRIQAAVSAARRIYPDPVAEVVVEALRSSQDFGFRFGSHGPIDRLVNHLLKPAPVDTEAVS